MACPQRLSPWQQEVSSAFAHLSKAQAGGLALWSAGIALSGSSGIVQISALLAQVLGQKEGTVFQRLREWYLDAAHKRGAHRRTLDVATCFGPLLGWIITRVVGEEQRLALALDATTLGNRWIILSVSVLVRGCAIPVAWKVLPSHTKGSWRPHWESLLTALKGQVPSSWQVLVLADCGLYARWLYTAIVACGWHPFLRINLAVKAREPGEEHFDWLSRWVPQPGASWRGAIECFAQRTSRLCCTLLVQWEAGYAHPWAILTDLPIEEAQIAWYGMRGWVEAGFKDLKRGGWGWHHSKMQDASRVERLWLAMAVAMVWTVSVGSQTESQEAPPASLTLPQTHVARKRLKRPPTTPPARRLSCLQRGRLVLLAALLQGTALPVGKLVSEPWPEVITPPKRAPNPTKQRQREQQRAYKRRRKSRNRRQAAA
jgi:hypothetical protein